MISKLHNTYRNWVRVRGIIGDFFFFLKPKPQSRFNYNVYKLDKSAKFNSKEKLANVNAKGKQVSFHLQDDPVKANPKDMLG